MSTVIVAPAVATSTGVHRPGWVHVDGGRVLAVGAGDPPTTSPDGALVALEAVGGTVVPGFVDVHCHGGGGGDVGDAGDEPAAVTRAAAAHLAHGTTTLVASLVSADAPTLLARTAALADRVEDGTVAGIHLEGPWLSPAHRGAHDPEVLRPPAPEEVAALLAAGRGAVRMVTLAPELPGALDAVRALVAAGVVAAVGHTDASAAVCREAFDAGASVVTHVFNGMRGVHHREAGPVVAALLDERVSVEVILDGDHVGAEAVELVRRAVGERLVLVSDAMSAACGPDGDYLLGALPVQVRDGVARLAEGGSLAGSTLTLDRAFARLVREHGASLPEAVRATATRPAAALGFDGAPGSDGAPGPDAASGRGGAGDLVRGGRADLVVLDDDLAVTAVMRGGAWIDLADAAAGLPA